MNFQAPPRWKGFRTLMLFSGLLACFGCQQDTGSVYEGFEKITDPHGLPKDWNLASDTGVYETDLTQDCKQGKVSLCLAGAGGKAKLYGKAMEVIPGRAICFRIWVRPKLFALGSTALIGICDTGDDSLLVYQDVQTSTENGSWSIYDLAYALPLQETKRTVRPVIELKGEGLLALDDVQQTVNEIVAEYQFADGDFEIQKTNSHAQEWDVSSDRSSGKALITEELPFQGKQCLSLVAGGRWNVATWRRSIPAKAVRVSLQGYARARIGKARLKVEHYRHGERLADASSPFISQNEWHFVSTASDLGLKDIDLIKLSLAGEQDYDSEKLWVDFDGLQVLVMKVK